MLGVSSVQGDGKDLHYLAVDQYITDNLGKYTYGEIKEAFNMLLKGEFKHLKEMQGFKLFNKLDCILLSKVMECYQIQKQIILKIYDSQLKNNVFLLEQKKNEISQDEKDKIIRSGIINCFNHYSKTGDFEFGTHYVYEVLEEKRLLNRNAEYRNEIMERVRKELETPKQKAKKTSEKGLKKAIQILKTLDDKSLKPKEVKPVTKEDIIFKSKMVVLAEYFDSLIINKETIEDKL